MKKILSLDEFNKYINFYNKNKCNIVTNYYPITNILQGLICEQKVRYDLGDNMLYMLCEKDGVDYMYFWSEIDRKLPLCISKKEVICEVFQIKGKDNTTYQYLLDNGFIEQISYSRMKLVEKSTPYINHNKIEKLDINIAKKNLFKAFNCYDRGLTFDGINEEECGAFTIKEGVERVGILVYSCKGISSTLEYIWIKEEYRNRGYATQLIKYYIEKLTSAHKSNFLWVADVNEKAQKLYYNLGYRKDRLEKKVLVMRV